MTEHDELLIPIEPASVTDSVNLVEISVWLLLGKKKILWCGFAFAVLGLAISLSMKNVYTANTEILPPHESLSQTLMNQMSGVAAVGSLSGMASALESKMAADSFVQMLGTRPVQNDLIERFGLMAVYHAKTMEIARSTLSSHTAVSATKENFIAISVTERDPRLASDLANGYVDSLRKLMRGLALTQASQRRIFYETQLDKTKEDLAQAEVAFKQMQQSNHILSVDAQSKALIDSASTLRAQISAKEVELQALRSYSTEANPQVQILEKELAAMRSQQAQMDANSQNSYSDIGLSSVPGAELNFVRATRELKYQESLYDLLVKQYEAARIDEAQNAPIVQIIEPAIIPDRKSGPKRSLIVLGALICGVIFGSMWALLEGWRQNLSASGQASLARLRAAAFQWSGRA